MPHGGRFVTERLPFDRGRDVTVYVPDAPPEAVVFAGDGQVLASWATDLEGRGLPTTMVVGVHRHEDEDVRLQEYSPPFAPATFAAHESFVVDGVRGWVAARFGVDLPADRTAVWGVSAGAELALALGLRHPDVFRTVLAASPGAGFRPDVLPPVLPRVHLLAGTDEPFFLENTTRWADALQSAGADVVVVRRPGEHGGAFWREEFPGMVRWAFGARPDR